VNAQAPERRKEMALDRAFGDEQLVGDLAVTEAQDHEGKDLLFALGQYGLGDRGSQGNGDDQLTGGYGHGGRCDRSQILGKHDPGCAGGQCPPGLGAVTSGYNGDAAREVPPRCATGQLPSVAHEHLARVLGQRIVARAYNCRPRVPQESHRLGANA